LTLILKLHGDEPELRHLRHACEALNNEKIVLVPTETGYCLVGDPNSARVFKHFLDLRQAHPRQKPFSVLCSNISQVTQVAAFDTTVFRIAKRILPGPYTFILHGHRDTPKHAGSSKTKSVGVRISSHPAAAKLCAEFGHPLLITSVTDTEELQSEHYYDSRDNSDAWWASGERIVEHFKNKIDVAFCGPEPIPMRSSTVVDFTQNPAAVVRDGGWPLEELGL